MGGRVGEEKVVVLCLFKVPDGMFQQAAVVGRYHPTSTTPCPEPSECVM